MKLLDSDGNLLVYNQGESADLQGPFLNMTGANIVLANLASLSLTLFDEATGTEINSRVNQNIFNANNCTVEGDGTTTIRLDPADNIIIGTLEPGQKEWHVARLQWSWVDGIDANPRLGIEDLLFQVSCLKTPVA